jgi:integrase
MSDVAVRPAEAIAVADTDPLAPLIDGWLALYPSRHTRAAYRRDVELWQEYLRGLGGTLTGAQHIHFLDWAAQLSGARTSRARRESAVTSFYDYCVEVGAIDKSPAHGKGAKRRTRAGKPDRPTPALTAEQGRAIVRAAKIRGPKDELVVATFYATGIRVSELVDATVGDVRVNAGRVTLFVTRKGGKSAEVEPDPETGALLAAAIEGRAADEPLIPSAELDDDGNPKPMTRDEASWCVEASGTAIGLDWVTPHVLRTSAINRLREAGHAPEDVQAFAGHAAITTTAIYFRRADEAEKRTKMAATMGEFLR